MNKFIISTLGFLLGLIGSFMALIPFLGFESSILYNSIIPIFAGILGFIFNLQIKKNLNDEIVMAGLIINPLAIILGVTQVFI